MELSNIIATYAMQFISITPVVVTLANIVTAFLPTQLSTKKTGVHIDAVNLVLRVLNLVSVNIGKNKNADDK